MNNERLNIDDFNKMSHSYRAQYTWSHGRHLSTRHYDGASYLLFQVESFFVEVGYDPKLNLIVCFKSFKDTENLSVYLDNISIEKML